MLRAALERAREAGCETARLAAQLDAQRLYESLGFSVRSEPFEEAGITVEPIRIAGVFGGPEYRLTYANGDEAGWVVTVFEARIVAGDPSPSDDETQAVGWFTPDETAALELAPSMRAASYSSCGIPCKPAR